MSNLLIQIKKEQDREFIIGFNNVEIVCDLDSDLFWWSHGCENLIRVGSRESGKKEFRYRKYK